MPPVAERSAHAIREAAGSFAQIRRLLHHFSGAFSVFHGFSKSSVDGKYVCMNISFGVKVNSVRFLYGWWIFATKFDLKFELSRIIDVIFFVQFVRRVIDSVKKLESKNTHEKTIWIIMKKYNISSLWRIYILCTNVENKYPLRGRSDIFNKPNNFGTVQNTADTDLCRERRYKPEEEGGQIFGSQPGKKWW